MLLKEITVRNYRGLRDVTLPLSRFGCLIGENNAGKSSTLQAIALFFSGKSLSTSNFFDPTQPVRIAIRIEEISERDILRLAPEHRDRVQSMVKNRQLTLVRLYNLEGKSSLLYNTLSPREPRFGRDQRAALMKGQRAGATFIRRVLEIFPELEGRIDAGMDQEAMRAAIDGLADSIPDDRKEAVDLPLQTGFDRSITGMLPDPIYIPAVKDLADDIKTSETTPFGKILAILLPALEAKLPKAQEFFKEINTKLNRVVQPDGSVSDERVDELREVETTVARYVNESFSSVSLRIEVPPPTMKEILASTLIYANDGVDGLIDSKGDGLRRAIVFSILRAYVELNAKESAAAKPTAADEERLETDETVKPAAPSYILMFEEPEIFLHPKAQTILFDALRVFSTGHQVLVTTHSPMFMGPNATDTFIKLRKECNASVATKPFTVAKAVDVSSMGAKDQFQIICFENNNAAFFANTVVLVEGDSDYLLMPHLARSINPEWDVLRTSVLFVRITGKGNIRRYRDFFSHFNVRVPVVVDLDFLVQGFDLIAPTSEMKDLRGCLLQRVDELLEQDGDVVSAKEAKQASESGDLKGLWRVVKQKTEDYRLNIASMEELHQAVDDFYSWQRKSDRNAVLKQNSDPQLVSLKHRLLEKLRQADVFVLEKGAIEEYYPPTITGPDKPSKAGDFCHKVNTKELVLACCGDQTFERDGVSVTEKEFNLIFQPIFGGALT
jgi:putative ATP-dependent endonuclease of the OLD family